MKEKYLDQDGCDSLIHLQIASRVGSDVFATNNESLLADKEELEEMYNIKILTPQETMGFKKGN